MATAAALRRIIGELLPLWSVTRAAEPEEAVFALRALLPGGLVGGGAGVLVWVEDHSHWTGLLVSRAWKEEGG